MEFLMNLHAWGDWALLALRVAVGAVFLAHGTQKWKMWSPSVGGASSQMPSGMLNLMRFLSVAEPLGAVAVLSGFLAQIAALGLSFVMVGAIWFKLRVWKKGFTGDGGWELDFLNIAACIALVILGAGNISLDHLLFGL